MTSSLESSPPVAGPLVQRWADYRPEEHAVWAALYRRRMERLPDQASRVFLSGLDAVGLDPERIPDLEDVNARLLPRTGWQAVPVAGFLDAPRFFAELARRRFPTTIAVRAATQMDYTPEPDIFHDVFGHVPLHADRAFADLLQEVGRLAARDRTPAAVEAIARLFWFTVEFGLIREAGRVRVYGSGLISSSAEAEHALGAGCVRRPFDLDTVLATPFRIDDLQPVLFVAESFDQVAEAVRGLAGR